MLQKQVDKMMHSDRATETPDTEEPQEKKIRTSDEGGKSLLDMLDEILEENSIMEQQAGLTSHTSVQV